MGFKSTQSAESAPTHQAPQMELHSFDNWASIPPGGDYTVIDTETTGFNARVNEVLEIGAIRYRDNVKIAQFQAYIKPEGRLSKRAAAVNHITWETVRDMPSMADVMPEFLSFIGDDVLIGYNVGFDLRFIQTRSGIDLQNYAYDVQHLAKNTVELDRYRLDDLRHHFNLPGSAHSAIGDCITTAAVFQECCHIEHEQER